MGWFILVPWVHAMFPKGKVVGYFPRISRHSWAIVLPIMPSRRARRTAKMIVCTIFNTFFGSLEPI